MLRRWVLVGLLLVLLLSVTGGAVAQEPVSPDIQAAHSVTTHAGVGTGFTYQGQLTQDGRPVEGTCDLQFGLWDAQTGGTQQGSTQPVPQVSVRNGLLTVYLNGGAEFGLNAFSGQKRYLEAQVRCPTGSGGYTTLAPRQELTAAPYALHALRASGLSAADGDPLNAVTVDHSGNVGIGTAAPAQRLHVRGNRIRLENADKTLDLRADGSAVDIQSSTPLWINSAGQPTFINPWKGNVGIGTTAPAHKLHIVGDRIKLQNGNKSLLLRADGSAVDITGSHPLWINVDGAPTFINPREGNVGIGTIHPQAKLDVAGWTRTDVLQIDGGADLAEPFSVAGRPEPGQVVAIDPEHVGQLRLADQPYDRRVAGVISGAGGLNPGLVMQQPEIVQGETHPVALCGRVYVWADASYGAIKVGDLLTTSATPGFAMRVSDHQQAQGAILGKAMSPLEDGQGLVLALVTLQ